MSYAPPMPDDQQDAAWIAFARTEWYTQISNAVPGLAERIGYTNPEQFHNTMKMCLNSSPESVVNILLDPQLTPSMTARELGAAFFIRRLDYEAITSQQSSAYCRLVSPYLPVHSPFHGYALFHECLRLCNSGLPTAVEEILNSQANENSSIATGALSIWQDSLFGCARGVAHFFSGDYKASHQQLTRSLHHASGLDFIVASTIRFRLAQLYRESGQFEKALSMWENYIGQPGDCFQHGAAQLVASHLNAARCAIDGKLKDRASSEVSKSSQLLHKIVSDYPRLQGFQYLREGELATLEERYEDGERLLRQALDFFRSIDPPCQEGLLETKIALGTYALFQDDLRMAWAIIRSLIEEAGERGCFPMRSRALLLQTWFFISSDPPTRVAFDNVLERIHMIQNPALMMHALGNLLSYAVNHLDESDRDHLLHRIRGLKSMLEESCYEQLYEQHVANRFAPAMEERFERKFEENDPETAMGSA